MKIAGYKVVCVEWIDSSSRFGWQDINENVDLRVVSIGFLILEKKDRIVLAKSIALAPKNEVQSFHSQMHIPKCAIKKLRHL